MEKQRLKKTEMTQPMSVKSVIQIQSGLNSRNPNPGFLMRMKEEMCALRKQSSLDVWSAAYS